ncbi:uncharacterized protein MELLADRAFT_104492 [Melampsora larici-populina 98AG31]|uniref:Uncharacterized protein n=1 Tax=Melampsora larici-populina (strain 98AG31 / pathotype 3-4-7) TaxID=747676 RepID=F4REW0_MELLP|nr:uncharacterized protein MELLADRAFT_104492 [Melampsora larici-populina 98AG31]EGG09175.1 hypothetical protein MELLADRAFT_104492 [Melampsora larici-populina 98AG31]
MLYKDFANPSTPSQPTLATRRRASSLPELHELRARRISYDFDPAYYSLRGDIITSEEVFLTAQSSPNSSSDYIPLASIETREAFAAIERNRISSNLNDQFNDSLIYSDDYIPLCSYRPLRTWKRVNEVREDRPSSPDHFYGSDQTLSRREQILKLFPTIPPPPQVPLPSLPPPIFLSGSGAAEIVWRYQTEPALSRAPSPPTSLLRKASIGTFGEPKLSPARALKQSSAFLRPRTMSGKLLKMFKYGRD